MVVQHNWSVGFMASANGARLLSANVSGTVPHRS